MENLILVSICIPAYKNARFVERLLESIAIQTFKSFEVIVTDDSNNSEVQELCSKYLSVFNLKYFKNKTPLGSPENWNEGIRQASGKWIKIMHDDDWFANEESLQQFADEAIKNEECDFIFSGFVEVDSIKNTRKSFVIDEFYLNLLRKSPLTLFKKNFIGHPSTTLVKNNSEYYYEKTFKWIVDLDFYIRYLSRRKNFIAIRKPLICIGINNEQITKQVFRKPEVEIPELLGLYSKLPGRSLRNIFCFDYYWRFLRNMEVRSNEDIKKVLPRTELPMPLQKMMNEQRKFSSTALRKGLVSKILMFKCYLKNYKTL